jgi:hypothetical protein
MKKIDWNILEDTPLTDKTLPNKIIKQINGSTYLPIFIINIYKNKIWLVYLIWSLIKWLGLTTIISNYLLSWEWISQIINYSNNFTDIAYIYPIWNIIKKIKITDSYKIETSNDLDKKLEDFKFDLMKILKNQLVIYLTLTKYLTISIIQI